MSAIIDVLRSMRRSGRGLMACPRCGETVRRSRAPLEGWILPVKYVCDKCGYSGFLAMEAEDVSKVR